MTALPPCDKLEKTLRIMHACLGFCGVVKRYWLCFGGLFGIIRNRGIIPDGDLDIAMMYGEDHERIIKSFSGYGYTCSKVMLNDTDQGKALYLGLNHENYVHICISFWLEKHGKRWYGHDQAGDLKGPGVPAHGYTLKGIDADLVNDEKNFKFVEYPGLPGDVKVRVPLMAGSILDQCYIGWCFQYQRWNVENNEVRDEKMASYFKGGAISKYQVHLKSIADFDNKAVYEEEIEKGRRQWEIKRREVLVKAH